MQCRITTGAFGIKLYGLLQRKRENHAVIYANEPGRAILGRVVRPMMEELYEQLLEDLQLGKQDSPIFRHHIDYVNQSRYPRTEPCGKTEPNQIIVDYIASMTDDYLIDLHRYLFPNSNYYVEYTGYFNDLYTLRSRLDGQIAMDD